jgi:hypothetical protein
LTTESPKPDIVDEIRKRERGFNLTTESPKQKRRFPQLIGAKSLVKLPFVKLDVTQKSALEPNVFSVKRKWSFLFA